MSDAFEDIVAGLSLDHVEADAAPVSELSDLELLAEYSQIRRDLLGTKDMIEPVTDEGRAMHSRRAALIVEMNNRGLS